MKPVLIDDFIAELRSFSEEGFKPPAIFEFLKGHPVNIRSLQPYLFFSKKFYTRNLIFKNDLFELMALCWAPGQVSRIHNHSAQNCWMTIPYGKLQIQDFKELESNLPANFCRIEPAHASVIDCRLPVAGVDPGDPIHQVSNLEKFQTCSVSLHVYSKPFERCLVYTPDKNLVNEVNLYYTSVGGKLCGGMVL